MDFGFSDSQRTHMVYTRRWYILFIFSALSFYQSAMWITYSPVAARVGSFYGIGEAQINLLLEWGPIFYLPVLPLVMWGLQRKDGLRSMVVIGGLLVGAGTVLRCASIYTPKAWWSYWMVSLGQIFIASAGPVVMTAPPLLSSTWFPVNQRTLATGIGTSSNSFGSAVAFVIAPYLVDWFGFRSYLVIEAAGGALVFIALVLYFPSLPPSPPSNSADMNSNIAVMGLREYFTGIAKLLKNRSVVILALVIGWISGALSAWQGLFDFIFPQFTPEFNGWLGFFFMTALVVGSVIGGFLCDTVFHKKFKLVIIVTIILTVIGMGSFSLALPSFFSEKPLFYLPPWAIILLVTVSGFVIGIPFPVFYELGVELTFPAQEAYSAGLITFLTNIVALVVLIAGSYIPATWVNGGVTISFCVCVIGMLFVVEDYKRLKVDNLGVKHLEA